MVFGVSEQALGDYTKVVTDFEGLGEELRRKDKGGGRLWYEDSVQAYFDDEEPFRRIKAMCRLSCSKCEECAPPPPDEPLPKGAVKKGHIFKSIESLRRHLFQTHKLIMCELCLKGRKVGPFFLGGYSPVVTLCRVSSWSISVFSSCIPVFLML